MTALEKLPTPCPYRLTVDDFLVLDATGVFKDHGKTELIEGNIVYMNAEYRAHSHVKMELGFALRDALRAAGLPLSVVIEATVAMAPNDAPEPDVFVTREPRGEGPVPLSSIALIVEVSDTTLVDDLTTKLRVYARHRVPEYWVADVRGRVLHQMWSPQGEAYGEVRIVSLDEQIMAATLHGVTLSALDV